MISLNNKLWQRSSERPESTNEQEKRNVVKVHLYWAIAKANVKFSFDVLRN